MAMVEFAFAFPVLALLLVAVVDLGADTGAATEATNAARVGARSGALGRVGDDDRCAIAGTPPDPRTRRLVCLVKAATHGIPGDVRVAVAYEDADGRPTDDFSEAARLRNEYSLVVCVAVRRRSISGALAPLVAGEHHRRAVTKTGATPWSAVVAGRTVYEFVPPFAEEPLDATAGSWDWCRA